MKFLIGLGNPEKRYEKTRHNVGFRVLDALAAHHHLTFHEDASREAAIAEWGTGDTKTLLIKPLTHMNQSGRAVANLAQYYHLNPEADITVIYDDVDLPLGSVRSRGESSGGHKGMQSIIESLGTPLIARIRIGIAPAPVEPASNIPTEDFVLAKFTAEEEKVLTRIIADLVPTLLPT